MSRFLIDLPAYASSSEAAAATVWQRRAKRLWYGVSAVGVAGSPLWITVVQEYLRAGIGVNATLATAGAATAVAGGEVAVVTRALGRRRYQKHAEREHERLVVVEARREQDRRSIADAQEQIAQRRQIENDRFNAGRLIDKGEAFTHGVVQVRGAISASRAMAAAIVGRQTEMLFAAGLLGRLYDAVKNDEEPWVVDASTFEATVVHTNRGRVIERRIGQANDELFDEGMFPSQEGIIRIRLAWQREPHPDAEPQGPGRAYWTVWRHPDGSGYLPSAKNLPLSVDDVQALVRIAELQHAPELAGDTFRFELGPPA